jgi:hypothetical protein
MYMPFSSSKTFDNTGELFIIHLSEVS